MRGHLRREKAAHRDSMYRAWHIAAFSRAKRMPSLAEAIGDKPAPQMKTRAQMLGSFRAMAKNGIGLTIRKIPGPSGNGK